MSILATDSFNRADANPIAGNWTTESGMSAWKILTNQAQSSANTVDCGAFYNAVTWPAAQWSQGTIIASPNFTGSGDGGGVSVRIAAAAKTDYELVVGSGTAGCAINKRVAGVFSTIATSASTFAANDVAYLEAQGTALVAKKNGATFSLSVSDGAITTGNAGLMFSSEGTAVGVTLDDWSGGDFLAGNSQAIASHRPFPFAPGAATLRGF